jgi:hypothetical protein
MPSAEIHNVATKSATTGAQIWTEIPLGSFDDGFMPNVEVIRANEGATPAPLEA